jgi:hypothetical protein
MVIQERNSPPKKDLTRQDLNFIHGSFINFWAVCTNHQLVDIFIEVFFKTLSILNPRILLVSSDKVSSILRSPLRPTNPGPLTRDVRPPGGPPNKNPPGGSTQEVKSPDGPTEELKPPRGSGEEVKPADGSTEEVKPPRGSGEEVKPPGLDPIKWDELAEGSFFREQVGKVIPIPIVNGHWSVMLVRFDCGFIAYRPQLQHLLLELNTLLAMMSQILVDLAVQVPVWNKDSAIALAEQSKHIFNEKIPLFELRKAQLCALMNGCLSLSHRGGHGSAEANFDTAMEEYQRKGAEWEMRMRNYLQRCLVSIGAPQSSARHDQMTAWLQVWPRSDAPRRATKSDRSLCVCSYA